MSNGDREHRPTQMPPRPPFGGPGGRPVGPRLMGRGPGGPLGMPGEKPKDFKGTLKRLTFYLKPRATQLITVIVFAVLSTVFRILGPKIMGKATTKLLEGVVSKVMAYRLHKIAPSIDFQYIGMIILILLGLYIISSIFAFIQQYIMDTLNTSRYKEKM